jgi:hypothetical protein
LSALVLNDARMVIVLSPFVVLIVICSVLVLFCSMIVH